MGLFDLFKNKASASGFEECKRDALAGIAQAQFSLGVAYEHAQFGLTQDYGESVKWYRKAAEQDHHAAQLYLGIALALGRGVEPDATEALMWVMLAKRGSGLDRAAANETLGRLEALMDETQIIEARVMAQKFANEHGG
jgi:hypothetical protein